MMIRKWAEEEKGKREEKESGEWGGSDRARVKSTEFHESS